MQWLDLFMTRVEAVLKGGTLEAHSEVLEFAGLTRTQQKAIDAFFRNEKKSIEVVNCLAFIAFRFLEESSGCQKALAEYEAGGVKGMVAAMLSIPELRARLGFVPQRDRSKSPLAEFELSRLAAYAIIHSIHDGAAERTPAEVFCEKSALFSDNYLSRILNDVLQPRMVDAFSKGLIAVQSDAANILLARVVTTYEALSNHSVRAICDYLFQGNDLPLVEQVSLFSFKRANTERIATYIDRAFSKSIEKGKPHYLYGRALCHAALEGSKFSLQREAEAICVTKNDEQRIIALSCLAISAMAQIRGSRCRIWAEKVAVTEALSAKLVELLSSTGKPAEYYATAMLVFELVVQDRFDTSLLSAQAVVEAALQYLNSADPDIQSAAERVLGMLPLTVKLPARKLRVLFQRYRRAIRSEECYNGHGIAYFRIILCCGGWNKEEAFSKHFKELYAYLNKHRDHLTPEDKAFLRLLRREIPSVIKEFRMDVETPQWFFDDDYRPSKIISCVLACRGHDFLQYPNQPALNLGLREAQAVLYLASRMENGYDDGITEDELNAVFANSTLEGEMGSYIILQWFQELCNRNCTKTARACYQRFSHILNRPWRYPIDVRYEDDVDLFFQFVNGPSRLRMAILEALHYGKTGVAQFFSHPITAPKNLPAEERDTLAEMLSDRMKRRPLSMDEVRSALWWEDRSHDLTNELKNCWSKFYDDLGVTSLVPERQPSRLLQTICEFGYDDCKQFAKEAMGSDKAYFELLSLRLRKDPEILEIFTKEE